MIDTTHVGMPPVDRLPAPAGVSDKLRAARGRIAELEQLVAMMRDLLRDAGEARASAVMRMRDLEDDLAAAIADALAWRSAYDREHEAALEFERERDEAMREFEMVLESRPVVIEVEP